jgi:Flp pilus assembly protein TadG
MHLRVLDVARDQTGSALVEFTFVLPALLLLVLGLAQFGTIYYNYILVTNATAAGARQFSIGRLDSNDYCDTVNAINNGSGGLGGSGTCTSNLTITLAVNGTACATGAGSANNAPCQTALNNAYLAAASPPQAASVTVSYQCAANSILPAYLLNLASLCPATRTMQGAVQ